MIDFAQEAMLANGSSGKFLGQSGVAELHNLSENGSDGLFATEPMFQKE